MGTHNKHAQSPARNRRYTPPKGSMPAPPSRPPVQIPSALMDLAVINADTPRSLSAVVEVLDSLVDSWALIAANAIPAGPPPGVERTPYTLMFEHIGAGAAATLYQVVLPTLVSLRNAINLDNDLGNLPIGVPVPATGPSTAAPFEQFGTDVEHVEVDGIEVDLDTASAEVAARLRSQGIIIPLPQGPGAPFDAGI